MEPYGAHGARQARAGRRPLQPGGDRGSRGRGREYEMLRGLAEGAEMGGTMDGMYIYIYGHFSFVSLQGNWLQPSG